MIVFQYISTKSRSRPNAAQCGTRMNCMAHGTVPYMRFALH